VLKAREVYQDQVLSHAGDFDEGNAWIELYTCRSTKASRVPVGGWMSHIPSTRS
jgi:hypothetical protein